MKRNTWILGAIAVLASVHFGGYGESSGGSCLDGCNPPSCSCLSSSKPEATEQAPIKPVASDSSAPLDKCVAAIAEARAKGIEEGRAEAFHEAAATASASAVSPQAQPVVVSSIPRETVVLNGRPIHTGSKWTFERLMSSRKWQRRGASREATLQCNGLTEGAANRLPFKAEIKICKFK